MVMVVIKKAGKWIRTKNDKYYIVYERRFMVATDKNTIYVAQASKNKITKKKEFWIGYYLPSGEQRGMGYFWKKYSEILTDYKKLFKRFKKW